MQTTSPTSYLSSKKGFRAQAHLLLELAAELLPAGSPRHLGPMLMLSFDALSTFISTLFALRFCSIITGTISKASFSTVVLRYHAGCLWETELTADDYLMCDEAMLRSLRGFPLYLSRQAMCRACQCTFNTPDLQGRPAHLVIKHRGSASRSEALLWQSHDSETARDRTFTKAWGTAACRKQVEPTKVSGRCAHPG